MVDEYFIILNKCKNKNNNNKIDKLYKMIKNIK